MFKIKHFVFSMFPNYCRNYEGFSRFSRVSQHLLKVFTLCWNKVEFKTQHNQVSYKVLFTQCALPETACRPLSMSKRHALKYQTSYSLTRFQAIHALTGGPISFSSMASFFHSWVFSSRPSFSTSLSLLANTGYSFTHLSTMRNCSRVVALSVLKGDEKLSNEKTPVKHHLFIFAYMLLQLKGLHKKWFCEILIFTLEQVNEHSCRRIFARVGTDS